MICLVLVSIWETHQHLGLDLLPHFFLDLASIFLHYFPFFMFSSILWSAPALHCCKTCPQHDTATTVLHSWVGVSQASKHPNMTKVFVKFSLISWHLHFQTVIWILLWNCGFFHTDWHLAIKLHLLCLAFSDLLNLTNRSSSLGTLAS